MNNTLEEIISKLNTAKRVVIFSHTRPDGDTLGAALSLYLHFKDTGRHAVVCCEELPPEKFMYLPVMGEVKSQIPQGEYDTFISVDCADSSRMSVFAKRYRSFKGVTINIDHHISNNGYAKFNYVVERPASCEIMTELFTVAEWEITREIADVLMLGLITDSGNFSHQDVSAKTFETAAILRRAGADVNSINYNMFARQPKSRALLYGKVMGGMRFYLDDKVALIVIRQSDMDETGADRTLTEGFVDFPLTVDGVKVSVSLLEFKNEQYKTSLRSKDGVNVNEIAAVFGGGGHILASGCMLFGTEEQVINRLLEVIADKL